MKTKIQKQKDAKLLKVLKELKHELKKPKIMSMSKFIGELDLQNYNSFIIGMQKAKVLKKTGCPNNWKWEWISGEPSLKMVDKIFEEKYKYNKNDKSVLKISKEENVLKYFNFLKKMKLILDNTDTIKMTSFVSKNNCSIYTPSVLRDGKIIESTRNGKATKWKWISIEPNRDMAIRTIQKITAINDEETEKRKKKREAQRAKEIKVVEPITLDTKKPKKTERVIPSKKTKTKTLDYYEIKFFFGLITLKVKSIFK